MEAIRSPWPALGALLVRNGELTAEHLEAALAEKRLTPAKRLGEILIDSGFVSRAAVTRVLAEQHDLDYIDLELHMIEPEVARLLPEKLARRYAAIPVRYLDNGSILVAVEDPTNVMFSDELRLALGVQVRVCVASAAAIELGIQNCYGPVVQIEEFAKEAAVPADQATVHDLGPDTPAVEFVNRSISEALERGASGIHFTPQERRLHVRVRVDGVMRELTSTAATHASAVASRLKIMAELDVAEHWAPQEGRITIRRGEETVDFSIAILPTTHGEKATLRLLAHDQVPDSLDALGLGPGAAAALQHAITQPSGAIVVVGPTGSGRTTTLHACLQQLNTADRQLTTIEDPIEYRAPRVDQVEVNPRAGLTFASGLETILHSDPDVLLVGEIREEEIAQIAFHAAMTGHLVLTSLHAESAAATIQRLTDLGVERSVLASSVKCIVGQRLVRRVCPDCREPYTAGPSELVSLGVPDRHDELTLYRAVGCQKCNETGYSGRVPLFEVLTMTEEISMLVGAPTQEIEAKAVSQGMSTLRDEGLRLAIAGATTVSEVLRVVGGAAG